MKQHVPESPGFFPRGHVGRWDVGVLVMSLGELGWIQDSGGGGGFENQTKEFDFYSVCDYCRQILLFTYTADITYSPFSFANRATMIINFPHDRQSASVKWFCRCLIRGIVLELIGPLYGRHWWGGWRVAGREKNLTSQKD